MRSAIPVVAALSLLLGGCCTQLRNAQLDNEDREWGSDLYWCGIFSGFGTAAQPDRSRALYTPVTPREYAELLCENVDLGGYASCMNQIRDYQESSRNRRGGEGSSTTGPFAMQVGGEVYLGSYWATPFESVFRVSNGRGQSCRGQYSAFFGSTDKVYAVVCDSGARGEARIVSDRHGRNGIGFVTVEQTEGRIVYGPDIARAARERL